MPFVMLALILRLPIDSIFSEEYTTYGLPKKVWLIHLYINYVCNAHIKNFSLYVAIDTHS